MAWSTNRFGDLQAVNRQMSSHGSGTGMPGQSRQNNMSRAKTYNPMNNQHRASGTYTPQQNNAGGTGPGFVAKLDTLTAGTQATVIGVVIAKESAKSIVSKKTGNTCFLLGFVIRDSTTSFVNCTFWGNEQFIGDVAMSFTIGDTVKLENVQVQAKPTDGSDEKFNISSPLGFQLMLSEKHSKLVLYNGLDLDFYSRLLYIPTKPSTDYYTLGDVLTNGQGLNGAHINLLVAIRKIGAPRDINTKNGRKTKRCEMKLFDESCSSFPLVLWGEELVNYSQTWTAAQTVLFIADVRVNFDDFRSSMIATADSKTIFTPNPETSEAKYLHDYVITQSFTDDDNPVGGESVDPPLDEIRDVIEIEQIATRKGVKSDYAILYGTVTKFDLDAENVESFLKRRCPKCKHTVTSDTGYVCSNANCTQAGLQEFNATGQVTQAEPDIDCSIPICISDHTGTVNSWLSGNILETMTGWSGADLMSLTVEQRTTYKWQYLMENCVFHVKILKNFKEPEKLSVRVLSCSIADPTEMLKAISAEQRMNLS